MNNIQAIKPLKTFWPGPALAGGAAPAEFMARATDRPLAEAFDRKFTIHAGSDSTPLADRETSAAFASLLARPAPQGLGIYIHLPFCRNQCLYCGFAGRRPDGELCAAYIEALVEESRQMSRRPTGGEPVRVIYLGGGTPSAVEPELLARLMAALRANFDLANDCEMTLEGRLHDFTPERAAGFLAAGFNRFSIGVQSFDTQVRRSLGRVSDRATVVKLLSNLISHQKAAIVIDLIYGLPGQSPDDFVADLQTAVGLGLDGLDTYQLNVFPGAPLDRRIREGRLPPAAALNEQGEYYRRAGEWLLGQRWRQLSLSHFAGTFRERNLYNPWAKRRGDCLGLGAGAGGFWAGWSYYRQPQVERYLKRAEQGDFTPDLLTPPAPNHRLAGLVVEQMEQGYLNYLKLMDDFGVEPGLLTALLANWRDQGLIELDGEWLNMTVSGRFWGVNLTQAVIETASRHI
ncbi:MAG: heme anaerobic degradation radical SAM methyltransferase ChuW/HutW [Candidatus Adiutrix sp.]|jgi:oxygen-independent coproporphyrinogen-3 oxidase|nr:heme anaerobic degradation radical SAM methyltransferase ChuW/HutW [Candidatus Adiutrix sp.]